MTTLRLYRVIGIAVILGAATAAAQTLLVDTGQPTGTQGPLLCGATCGAGSTFQDLAGQFTLTQSYSISSVEAWIQAPSTGGQLAVVIRSDNSGLPGSSVFSQTYTVPSQTTAGWVTFTFTTQPVLNANTPYWLSFEPVAGSAISYNVLNNAPNPLPLYALYNSLNSGWFTEAFSFGIRISGTPAQGATLLVDTGAGETGFLPNGSYGIFNGGGSNFEYLAGQFTLDQAATLESVAGWMQVTQPGNININIYGGNEPGLFNDIVPGASVYLQGYAQSATGQEGWVPFQFSEPYPTLSAGTYWLSFEPVSGNLNASMAPGVPNPLTTYAYFNGLNGHWLNQSFNGAPLNVGMQVSGSKLAAQASGTAARAIMTGTAFALPDTPQDIISGGDGVVNTPLWNFIIPSGWSYGRGTIVTNGLQAGAFAATSGPCEPPGTCGIAGGRGVAYRTWTNTGNASVSINMNVVLSGEFEATGGTASAGVYVFDATAFTNAISGSGLAAPQFLLNNSTLTSLSTGGTNLASLFPNSAVLLNVFQTFTGAEEGLNQVLNLPLTTGFFTVAPQQSVTVMFDVTAYAPPFGWSNFADTLEPSPTLPLFTDQNGNAVPQLVAVGPSAPVTPAPAALALTPATASYPAGTNGTVTATVKDANNNPVPNAVVFFAFNSGPNVGPAGPIATDSNGNATFTYNDNGGAGTDVIGATLGSLTATPVSITWTTPGPLDHITISPATAAISSGGTQAYAAAAFDRFNNSIGDVTPQTTFSIAPDGSCSAANCTASVAGVHTVTGTDSGKTAQASLTVNAQTTPVITWATPAAITYGMPLSAAQLNATANVPGTFVYTPGLGAVLTAGIQTLSVSFTPTNTTSYTTASAHVNLQVNQAIPVVTWATPAPIAAGTALSGAQLDATANVPGTFVYTPGLGTVLSAGNQSLKVNFTPTDTTDYSGGSAQVTLVVNAGKANPAITWPTPAAIPFGTPLSSQQLDATANVPGTFAYSPKAGTILKAGSQTLTVTFTPSNTSAYNNATASVTLQVNQAKPPILWVPLPLVYGTPLGVLQLDALTLVPGTFVYTPPAGTILQPGEHTLSAVFTPKDTTDFEKVTITAVVAVVKGKSH